VASGLQQAGEVKKDGLLLFLVIAKSNVGVRMGSNQLARSGKLTTVAALSERFFPLQVLRYGLN